MKTNDYLPLSEIIELIKDDEYDWQSEANCLDVDSTIFIPTDMQGRKVSQLYKQAKEYCYQCNVRPECLAFSLHMGLDLGVFGGLAPLERKNIHKKLLVREIFKKKDLKNGRKN